MRVAHPDQHTLVVRDVPIVQYIFAAACVAAAFGFALLALRTKDAALRAPTAIAFGVGVLSIWLSPVTTSTFDRRQATYEVRLRGLFRNTVRTGALSNIAAVEVDEAVTDTTFRVVLRLWSGSSISLSHWWTAGKRRSRKIAARISAFLTSDER